VTFPCMCSPETNNDALDETWSGLCAYPDYARTWERWPVSITLPDFAIAAAAT